jgi:hypothetical protein
MTVLAVIAIAWGTILLTAVLLGVGAGRRGQKLERRVVDAGPEADLASVTDSLAARADARERAARSKHEQAFAEVHSIATRRERRFTRQRDQRAREPGLHG